MSQQAFGAGPEYSSSRNKLHVQGGEVIGEAWRVLTWYPGRQAKQVSKKLGLGKSERSRQLSQSQIPADFQREREFSTQESVKPNGMYQGKLEN